MSGVTIGTVVKLAQKVVAPVRNRVNTMVVRAVLDAVKDDPKLQTLKLEWFGGPSEPVEHMMPGGLTHVPRKGAEFIFLRTSQGVQMAVGGTERGARPTGLKAGETQVYGTGDAADTYVHIKSDGSIEIHPKPGQGVFIGDESAAEAMVLGTKLQSALNEIKAWMDAVHMVLTGAPIPEPGMGSPSALQTTLAGAVAAAAPPTDVAIESSKHKLDE